jgi:hypothetical protein
MWGVECGAVGDVVDEERAEHAAVVGGGDWRKSAPGRRCPRSGGAAQGRWTGALWRRGLRGRFGEGNLGRSVG